MDSLKDKHILLVDDETATLEMLSKILRSEGYTNIVTASDGVECLSVLDQLGEKVYVILLDLFMPKMPGLQVMRHLVNVHKHVIGIVIVTGHASLLSAEEFKALGTETIIASDYLSKPMDALELLADVEKTLELVHQKRQSQSGQISTQSLDEIKAINAHLSKISDRLDKLEIKQPGFLGQLGSDVVRTILLGLFILIVLYFGLGDYLVSLMKKIQ